MDAKLRFPILARVGAAAYPLGKRVLFRLDPETAHEITVKGLALAGACGLARGGPPPGRPVECMGLKFPNAVGLAAGMDKDAVAVAGFGAMGFGFIEVGTLTPRPQPGNDQPRLFRLVADEAIINRMGFNNSGIDAAVARLHSRSYRGLVGVNIGRNKTTPNERALDDYQACLRAAWPVADYIAVNISSPNTPGLRDLLLAGSLRELLGPLRQAAREMQAASGRRVPLAVKIAPDLADGQLEAMAAVFAETGIDGVIATNTTIGRERIAGRPHAQESGGLSGRPLREASTGVIRRLRAVLDPAIPIIGVGGICSAADAREKIAAGAALVQIYSGLVFRGPGLVADCVRALADVAATGAGKDAG
jgi:dihydroorotate dehydrogenase